jgi:hypothetical protein
MQQQVSEGREVVYDAVLYGLGATLGELAKTELGARFAEELHKSVGQHMAEYLTAKGITYIPRTSSKDSVRSILGMFLEQLDFARLEKAEPTERRGTHGVWRDILGLKPTADSPRSTRTRSCPVRSMRSSATSWPSRTTPSGSTAAPPTSPRACWSPGRPWCRGRASSPPRCRPPEAMETRPGPATQRAQDRGPGEEGSTGMSSRSCRRTGNKRA